jgi:pyrrolidone-carboxylate peptidase
MIKNHGMKSGFVVVPVLSGATAQTNNATIMKATAIKPAISVTANIKAVTIHSNCRP